MTVEELFSDASAAPDLPQTVTVEVIEPTEPEAAPEPEPTEPTATAGPEAAAAAEPAGQAAPSAPSDADPLEPAPAKPARPASARKPSAPRAPAKSAAAPAAKVAPRRPAKPRPAARSKAAAAAVPSVVRDLDPSVIALSISGLTKRFGSTVAVAGIDLDVPQGSFYGIVGPNGAGKTTTLSMVTGMLRPDGGSITVLDTDVWRDPAAAKRLLGVLPDRLRLFDRLTGRQLLYYSGTLRKLDNKTVTARSADLAAALGLEDALGRLVSDYSAGMTKKLALACAMIHSPRVLVLDEPFESIDPVSAANVTEILEKYVAGGGTVVVSSHSMDMIQRVCDRVAIIVEGSVLAKGTVDEVRAGETLEERFMELAGTRRTTEGMEWLLSSSD
ncbi:ABC transporter ATP-binding protein [Cnuibacter physcomitrellae]|uniref:ABC transporter ATP-binding protein n=1 Tax=Cnuibacter physcomitrellae TaxID=1619308 RepID=A0A1X9LQ61_9MICO|nr:ABC transporter ATP-binding protein [Cnuibacter physcomitrellae]